MLTSIPDNTLEKFTSFGDLLRFLRRRAGLTQLELSIAVGYSDAQISRLEQGLRLPDIPTIEARFVSALGLEDEPKAVARLMDLAVNVRREDAPGLGLCPYKGLNYFDETDADLFVGREVLTEKLVGTVLKLGSGSEANEPRCLAIVGASGSGKSSLVRAGLVPALRWNKISANWPIHVFTPTAHPLESLAATLTQEAGSIVATAALMDDLMHESRSLSLYINRVSKSTSASHHLLVVDQFEELFTVCRSEDERIAFIDNLLTAISIPGGPMIVVIVLRADFYAYCARYALLRDSLAQNQEYIGAMSEAELRCAIEEPAKRERLDFEPGLVDLLLHDVGHEPGALPLLSHALLETWRRRRGHTLTLSGYAASGGVRGAITETAEAVFADQFNADQQMIARRIFLSLTELGDETSTGDTRRRVPFSELILKPEEESTTKTVLMKLADARLITTKEDSVEVAHEALIREWPKLRGWLEENREVLRLHRHLTETAKEWATLNREPGGLYRGARLALACEWAETHSVEMNKLEREFLDASQAWAEREADERELQRQRELETAQKLAEAEKQRAEVESQHAEEQARATNQLHKRALYLAGAFILALLMAFVALFFGAQARQAAISAQDQQRVAFSRELAAAAISNLGVDPERSILLAMQSVSVTYSIDKSWTDESENALRRSLQTSRLELTLRGHTDLVAGLAFSPDGTRLATSSDDGTARIWDASSGKELLTLSTNAFRGHHGLAFSPDGSRLATAGSVGTVKVWETDSGQEVLTLNGHLDWVSSVAFSPDGKYLATASEDRTAKVWDAHTGQNVLTLTGHNGPVWAVAFSPDGKRLATASEGAEVKIWDAATGQELLTFAGHTGPVYSVSFSPDGSRLATASQDGTAKIWDVITGKELQTLRGHTDIVAGITFSPDGTQLTTTSFDGKVKVWDADTGQELLTLAGHTGPVLNAAFSPDGRRLATVSFDGTAKVWNTGLSGELLTLSIPGQTSSTLSPDGKRLAAGFLDGTLKVWDISTTLQAAFVEANADVKLGGALLTLHGHDGPVWGLAFSSDGLHLASTGEDQTARLWDMTTGTELLTLRGHTAGVHPVAFSPDGTRIATSSSDYTVRVWDGVSGIELLSLGLPENANGEGLSVTFSPDGSRLAAGLKGGTAKVWNASTGKELLTLLGHTGEVLKVVFSPDGTKLATASADRTAKLWDAATGQVLFTLAGHNGAVNDIAFSPNGRFLATAGQDGMVKLWDAVTGQELKTLYEYNEAVVKLDFSPDGSWLLSMGANGVARFFLLGIKDLMALAHTRVTRTLSTAECQQYLHIAPEYCPQGSSTGNLIPYTKPSPMPDRSKTASGKVCEVTNDAGLNDQFFNQIAYDGLQNSAGLFGWEASVHEPSTAIDYEKYLEEVIQEGCDLIVLPTGIDFSDLARVTAEANPAQKFQIMDWSYNTPLDNMWEQVFAVDQAGFMAGYLAASVTKTGKVGTYGGINFPRVTDFMNGFALGVDYYNVQNGGTVEVLGWDVNRQEGIFAGNFNNIDDGRQIGEMLLDKGADIILPVAGGVGLGTASVLKERGGAYLIGVDSDWVVTYPEYADIILTSVQKRLDASVVSAVRSIVEGSFTGGIHIGALENGGVSLAPFHNLDNLVMPQVKADLEQIKTEIIAGKIQTKP